MTTPAFPFGTRAPTVIGVSITHFESRSVAWPRTDPTLIGVSFSSATPKVSVPPGGSAAPLPFSSPPVANTNPGTSNIKAKRPSRMSVCTSWDSPPFQFSRSASIELGFHFICRLRSRSWFSAARPFFHPLRHRRSSVPQHPPNGAQTAAASVRGDGPLLDRPAGTAMGSAGHATPPAIAATASLPPCRGPVLAHPVGSAGRAAHAVAVNPASRHRQPPGIALYACFMPW